MSLDSWVIFTFTALEIIILEISIEILREVGIRLPKPIGPAMGIVGDLVNGDAAVNAGLKTRVICSTSPVSKAGCPQNAH